MRKLLGALVGLLLFGNCFAATELKDEGTSQGYVNILDIRGSGATAQRDGITGFINVTGGGNTSGNVSSWNTRTGDVIPESNDYSLDQISDRSHTYLTDIGTLTHDELESSLSAIDGGLTSTNSTLANLTINVTTLEPIVTEHVANTSNPHSVTTAQIGAVDLTTNQTIDGNKTFVQWIRLPDGVPIDGNSAVTLEYLDSVLALGTSWRLPVKDMDRTSPPTSGNVSGDRFVVHPTGADEWAGHDNDITTWNGTAWNFDSPSNGWTVLALDDYNGSTYNGAQWVLAFKISAYTASNGISLSGTNFELNLADEPSGLEVVGSGVRAKVDNTSIGRNDSGLEVKPNGITNAMLAGNITNDKFEVVNYSKGGTSLTTIGGANSILGVNSVGNGYENKTLVPGANVSITHGTNSITIDSIGGSGGSVNGTLSYIPHDIEFQATGSTYYGYTVPVNITPMVAYFTKKEDLSGATQFRLKVTQGGVAPKTGSKMFMRYSTDAVNYYNISDSTCEIELLNTTAARNITTPYFDIASGAKQDVWLQWFGYNGTGALIPRLYRMTMEVKYGSGLVNATVASEMTTDISWAANTGATESLVNVPLAYGEITNNRRKIDLSAFESYRIVGHQVVGNASAPLLPNLSLNFQYSTDATNWYPLDTANASAINIQSTGTKQGVFSAIPEGAKQDVWLRLVGWGGNGVFDPGFRQLSLQLKGRTGMINSTSNNTEIIFNNQGVLKGDPRFFYNTTTGDLQLGNATDNIRIHQTSYPGYNGSFPTINATASVADGAAPKLLRLDGELNIIDSSIRDARLTMVGDASEADFDLTDDGLYLFGSDIFTADPDSTDGYELSVGDIDTTNSPNFRVWSGGNSLSLAFDGADGHINTSTGNINLTPTSGNVYVNGDLHATAYYGDGSNLTGIANPSNQSLNTTDSPTFVNETLTGKLATTGLGVGLGLAEILYPFHVQVRHNTTVGEGTFGGYIDYQGNFTTNSVPIGWGSYVRQLGGATPGTGHFIGIWGSAEDTVINENFLIGLEGKALTLSTNATAYGGVYYSMRQGSMNPVGWTVGNRADVEITVDGNTANPNSQGVGINYWAQRIVGGATGLKFSFLGYDELKIDGAPIRAYANGSGTNYLEMYATNSSSTLKSAGVNNLGLEAPAGQHVIVTASSLSPSTDATTDLSLPGYVRWNNATLAGWLSASNLTLTNGNIGSPTNISLLPANGYLDVTGKFRVNTPITAHHDIINSFADKPYTQINGGMIVYNDINDSDFLLIDYGGGNTIEYGVGGVEYYEISRGGTGTLGNAVLGKIIQTNLLGNLSFDQGVTGLSVPFSTANNTTVADITGMSVSIFDPDEGEATVTGGVKLIDLDNSMSGRLTIGDALVGLYIDNMNENINASTGYNIYSQGANSTNAFEGDVDVYGTLQVDDVNVLLSTAIVNTTSGRVCKGTGAGSISCDDFDQTGENGTGYVAFESNETADINWPHVFNASGLEVNNVSVLTVEADPWFNGSVAFGITSDMMTAWNTTASGYVSFTNNETANITWGYTLNATGIQVAGVDVITAETDPVYIADPAKNITLAMMTSWNGTAGNNHTAVTTSNTSTVNLNLNGQELTATVNATQAAVWNNKGLSNFTADQAVNTTSLVQHGKLYALQNNATPSYVDYAVKGLYNRFLDSSEVVTGVYGEVNNTGNITQVGSHAIAVLGRGWDTANGKTDIYGGEFRTDTRGSAGITRGSTSLARWINSTENPNFNGRLLYGSEHRAEIVSSDDSTPLLNGTAIAIYQPEIVGGQYQYGALFKNQVRIDDYLRVCNSTGSKCSYQWGDGTLDYFLTETGGYYFYNNVYTSGGFAAASYTINSTLGKTSNINILGRAINFSSGLLTADSGTVAEADPFFNASASKNITLSMMLNWNSSYAQSHTIATILDTSSFNFTLTGQQISGTVIGGGVSGLNASNLSTGNVNVSRLNSGTGASATTFWRGDGAWSSAAIAAGGYKDIDVAHAKIGHLASPATIDGSQNRWYLNFANATTSAADWSFIMPLSYTGTLNMTFTFKYKMATATSGNVKWGIQLMKIANATVMETDNFGNLSTVTSGVPITAGQAHTINIPITNTSGITAGDMVVARALRIGNDTANDTAVGTAQISSGLLSWY